MKILIKITCLNCNRDISVDLMDFNNNEADCTYCLDSIDIENYEPTT